jgi:hypothetical protein
MNKTKSWFFEKINKNDKPLVNLIKMSREKTQINKIRNQKGEIIKESLRITLKTYIHINWRILNKWTNF